MSEKKSTAEGLAVKLMRAQERFIPVKRNRRNDYTNSNYNNISDSLAMVKPRLLEEGLLLTQPLSIDETGDRYVKTVIMDPETGEVMESAGLPVIVSDNMQHLGSCISYIRRYDLESFLGIETAGPGDDDDGNATVDHTGNNQGLPVLEPDNEQVPNIAEYIRETGDWSAVRESFFIPQRTKTAINKIINGQEAKK